MRLLIDGRVIQDHFPGIARYTYHLARALPRVAPEITVTLLYDPTATNTRYDLAALARDHQIHLVPHAAIAVSAGRPVAHVTESWPASGPI